MATVTIVGSDSPSVYLARGKQVTVQETAHIRRLIRGGFVKLVSRVSDEAPAVRDELGVPARNASREDWAAFLTMKGIAFSDGETRADLIKRWDDFEDPEAHEGSVPDPTPA